MIVLFLGAWCRPFYNYWSVPAADPQCATYENHLILNLSLNVSSDLMIMAIPLPLLLRSKLPPRKKLLLTAAFSLGGFVIASAVMNRYYSFINLYGTGWESWFVREASTAVIVANSPYIWALVRIMFNLHSFVGSSSATVNSRFNEQTDRFYKEIDDPLSPRRQDHSGSSSGCVDNTDIDKMLASVEREAVPFRFSHHGPPMAQFPKVEEPLHRRRDQNDSNSYEPCTPLPRALLSPAVFYDKPLPALPLDLELGPLSSPGPFTPSLSSPTDGRLLASTDEREQGMIV